MYIKGQVMFFTFLAIVFPGGISGQAVAPPPIIITESINSSQLVPLPGNIPAGLTSQNDQGAVAGSMPMGHLSLQLKPAPERQAALQQYLEELTNPESPNYHRWLSAQEFGQRFGLAQQDLDTVTEWLQSYGLTVNGILPNRSVLVFSGTAQQVSAAFHTSIHHLKIDGPPQVSNINDPEIPKALALAIAGIVGLDNIFPKAAHTGAQLISPDLTSGNQRYVTPPDLARIYNFNPIFQAGYTGKGQTIAVVEDSNVYSASDWTQFRKVFGLTRPYVGASFVQIHPSSAALACTDPGVNGDAFEANIDAQWSSAAAPNANIVVASCANTTEFGGFIAITNLVNSDTPPDIVSVSYQESEPQLGTSINAFINAIYQQATAEGISIFVATGDSGADANTFDREIKLAITGISANGLASTPYNVAVGGTDYEDTYLGQINDYWTSTNTAFGGSAKSYIPEIPWNASCGSALFSSYHGFATPNAFCNSSAAAQYGALTIDAGSGAPSRVYAKPAWQSVLGNPADSVRDIPDVSLFAANGPWGHAYTFCYSAQGNPCSNSEFYEAGGTSFSAPIMAGFQALVNEKTGGRSGNPNPIYYALARKEYGSGGAASCNSSLGVNVGSQCLFHDVTQGDIVVLCRGKFNCYATAGAANGVLSTSSTTLDPAYTAHVGWDFATGIGTLNAYNLFATWPAASSASSSAAK